MGATTEVEERQLDVWSDRIDLRVKVSGEGPPLLWLHGAGGLEWGSFHEELTEQHRVYAPLLPGTTDEFPNPQPDAVRELDGVFDLMVCYAEVLDRLGLSEPLPVIGHSMGGMMAAEFASVYPRRVSRLVLLSAVGLWRDEHPIPLIPAIPPEELPGKAFADGESEQAQDFFALPEDPDEQAEAQGTGMWNTACGIHFMWPVADNGLENRIHRIDAPTKVIWGAQDGLIPPAYAPLFGELIADSEVHVLEQAAHMVHVEQLEEVSDLVLPFVEGG